jgi:hypothetical protein
MSKGTDFTGGTDDPMDQTMPLEGLSDLGVTRSSFFYCQLHFFWYNA